MTANTPKIWALLGPTNTGKTHRAVERMLEHDTGMIGLPLRLLAREVYDRISERLGEAQVALVTGEERRIPKRPRYWVCTVEAMPTDRRVDFIAVDEIQLAGHPERGHVFTQRLLETRGARETWFMGAHSMRPLISELVPDASFQRFARLSKLVGAGSYSTGSLPPRSAVVAFSRASVYELAERMRARRGGAAVVMGSLSPRARNAQVAMYQAGEVDYLVATDAIGMGLNLDVDRIAFAELNKFDGRRTRALELSELSQIAGRAGRYQNDGEFGTLAPEPALSEQVSRRLERHQLPTQKQLIWRNSQLRYDSIDALLGGLLERPRHGHFRALEHADDVSALRSLAKRPKVVERAVGENLVALLWEVCQIPDYRQLLVDHHANLLEEIYLELVDGGPLKDDWFGPRIARLDRVDGDIETLTARIAFVRTWTYLAHRAGWLRHANHWQAQTRVIEDRLSDALHEALVARFVERKRAYPAPPSPSTGDTAGGNPFSSLRELRARLFGHDDPTTDELSFGHALADAAHHEFEVDDKGKIRYRGELVAKLIAGRTLTEPAITLTRDDLGAGEKSRVMRRLRALARDYVSQTLGPLADETGQLSQDARGLVYQLTQGLGTIGIAQAAEQTRRLTSEDREHLAERGVVLGKLYAFCDTTLDGQGLRQRAVLARVFYGSESPALSPDRVSHPVSSGADATRYLCLGYAVVANTAIRVDRLERLLETRATDWQSVARAFRLDRGTAERVSRTLGVKRRKRRRRRHKPQGSRKTGA